MSRTRVVSLVPSATETILEWGVEPIAVTRFCEQPEFATVGGTKDPDLGAVQELAPDLVLMCVEENRVEDADALRAAGIELFVFDIDGVEDVAPQLRALADRLEVQIPQAAVALPSPSAEEQRAFVPIWRRPWMSLRAGTYGSSVLRHIGVGNVFAEESDRYPEITLDEAVRRRPDVVLAPSEPYPFAERHRAELEAVSPVTFVDGKDLFWWGIRTPAALVRLHEQLLATDN